MAGPTPTVVDLNTAEQMMHVLSPFDRRWGRLQRYIFRGQPDASYKLTPSICRRGEGSFGHGSIIKTYAHTIRSQINFEINTLAQFLKGCDRSGLVLPGYTEDIMKEFGSEQYLLQFDPEPWPQKRLHQIMAVAQHYGVPTRLLDWTERSYVACYFAASMADMRVTGDTPRRIAVWALDTKYSSSWETVKIIRTPGGTSANQAAQSGLFTAHIVGGAGIDLYEPEALESVEEIYNVIGDSLTKFTLPVHEVPALLDSCKLLGVEASTLFPGHEGVARGVRDWAHSALGRLQSESFKYEMDAKND